MSETNAHHLFSHLKGKKGGQEDTVMLQVPVGK